MDSAARRAMAYPVPALEKGLDVLEALSGDSAPQSLAELARRLRRSSSELFRMMNCLERRGYVVKEKGTGRYRLSLKLYELAHTHSPVEELLRAAEAPMRRVAQELRESCHLSALHDGHLTVLAQAESPERVRFSVEIGTRHPTAHTVSGRLLLAHVPQEELDRALARDPDVTAMAPPERRRFLSELLSIRRAGFSTAESETFQGVRDVAVLVGRPRLGLSAALCVPALKIRGRWPAVEKVRSALDRAVKEIHGALGLAGTIG